MNAVSLHPAFSARPALRPHQGLRFGAVRPEHSPDPFDEDNFGRNEKSGKRLIQIIVASAAVSIPAYIALASALKKAVLGD